MDLDLCNAALALLACGPMADPSRPNGRVEQAAARHCLQVRAEVCEAHAWSHCDKTWRLYPEADGIVPPGGGFTYVAVLPGDCLGVWKTSAPHWAVAMVGDGEETRRRIAWAGEAAILVRGSADVPYRVMNPLLRRACAAKLAALLAPIQSEKASDRKIHADLALADELRCAARDALNRQEAPLFNGRWDPANAGGDVTSDPRGGSW